MHKYFTRNEGQQGNQWQQRLQYLEVWALSKFLSSNHEGARMPSWLLITNLSAVKNIKMKWWSYLNYSSGSGRPLKSRLPRFSFFNKHGTASGSGVADTKAKSDIEKTDKSKKCSTSKSQSAVSGCDTHKKEKLKSSKIPVVKKYSDKSVHKIQSTVNDRYTHCQLLSILENSIFIESYTQKWMKLV